MAEIKAERGHLFYRRVIQIIIFHVLASILLWSRQNDCVLLCTSFAMGFCSLVRSQTDKMIIVENDLKKSG